VITRGSTPRIAAIAVAAIVALLALAPPAAAAATTADDTGEIFAGLNAARASAGKGALAPNASLDAVAVAWAGRMAADGAMTHNPNTGTQIPAGWNGWGENVAHGFATGSATNVGWTDSPEHYANMMGDFTDVGIAFVVAGGTSWAVEVFADYPATAAAASTVVTGADQPESAAKTATGDGAGPVSSDAPPIRPSAFLVFAAVPVAAGFVALILVRARRKRVVGGEHAR